MDTSPLTIRLATRADARRIGEMSRDYIERGLGWNWDSQRVAYSIAQRETNVAVAAHQVWVKKYAASWLVALPAILTIVLLVFTLTFSPVALLLNVTPDHMDRYATFDDYAAAKYRIFRNQKATDVAIVSALAPGRAVTT